MWNVFNEVSRIKRAKVWNLIPVHLFKIILNDHNKISTSCTTTLPWWQMSLTTLLSRLVLMCIHACALVKFEPNTTTTTTTKKMNKYKRKIQTKKKPLQNKMPTILNKVNRCTNTKICAKKTLNYNGIDFFCLGLAWLDFRDENGYSKKNWIGKNGIHTVTKSGAGEQKESKWFVVLLTRWYWIDMQVQI